MHPTPTYGETPPLGYFTKETSAEIAIARMAECKDERLKTIMSSVIRHLHAVVNEVEPTPAEWAAAIEFLTRTGQMCTAWRQEFILLSDVLGVSMLVDAVNHRAGEFATESTVLGPFHVQGAPKRAMGDNICLDGIGEPVLVRGRVLDAEGAPISGAVLDVWQANGEGFYDVQQQGLQPSMNLRGQFQTAADGRYWFRTIRPRHYAIPHDGTVGQMLQALGRHPNRPAHIHFIVAAGDFAPVTTHIFVEGDPFLDSDAVFGVKESLVARVATVNDAAMAADAGLANPFSVIDWDFHLKRHSQNTGGGLPNEPVVDGSRGLGGSQ